MTIFLDGDDNLKGMTTLSGKNGNGERRAEEDFATKNFGDAHRVPTVALLQLLSASCCFSSLLSFWLPWIYSPFPFFMEYLQRCFVATS
jgi:hypothetical protein